MAVHRAYKGEKKADFNKMKSGAMRLKSRIAPHIYAVERIFQSFSASFKIYCARLTA